MVYSRHLQQKVSLSIITTPMPDNKEEMNLLFFNGDKEELKACRAKKIIDSLYKKKLIQPLTLVAFEGKAADHGLEESDGSDANQYKKFNDFVAGELYPFVKKKVVIRKFHSVAIYGSYAAALSAFDIAWNNDEKIQRVGMLNPIITNRKTGDTSNLATLHSLRMRPNLDFWISAAGSDSVAQKFANTIGEKCKGAEIRFVPGKDESGEGFADFLVWAFPR